MSETIEPEVGSLYAEMHNQYSEELGEQYEERLRQTLEDFIHNFNQQVERQQEQLSEGDIDLEAVEDDE